MSTPNSVADKFVLLFSADWFRAHWSMTGFVPKDGNGAAFQHEIRNIVERMMEGTPCYWHIDFSEGRLKETRDALLGALARHEGKGSNLSLIQALVMGEDPQEALTDVSMKFWDDYETRLKEIDSANVGETDWDRGLVALTPDLPDLLQVFAWTVLRGIP